MSKTLVFCERDEVAAEILSACATLGASALVLGEGARERASRLASFGAQTIYFSSHPGLAVFDAEVYVDFISRLVSEKGIEEIFVGSTRRGRELAPRLAQKLDASCITDVNGKDEGQTFWRYTLGGNTVEKISPTRQKRVVAFMPKAFEKSESSGKGEIVELSTEPAKSRITLVEKQEKVMGQTNIEDAEKIVGIGRGVAKKEDLALVGELASTLGAEIGCTRPLASDLGWLTEDRIIGLSGKKTKPKFYLALGVSGQIQHTVGIRDSKIIAAIDKNKEAPIFRMADYGIVGDLYEFVPLIVKKLTLTKE